MKRLTVALWALVAVSCVQDGPAPRSGKSAGGAAPAHRDEAGDDAHHQMYRPDQLQWKDGPPSLPAGAKFAVLEGDPSKPGFFAMRLKLPDGYRIPPHWHPVVERVTVVSGTFRLGTAEQPDWDAMHELPAGSYTSMQPGMRHYARVSGETVVQLATVGPWGINYVNASDDPRRKPRR